MKNIFVAFLELVNVKHTNLWKGMNHVLPVAKFIEAWTGIVLLAESSKKSGEPDYKKHRKTEQINLLKKIAFFSACTLILLFAYFNQLSNYSVILLLNLTGVFIS